MDALFPPFSERRTMHPPGAPRESSLPPGPGQVIGARTEKYADYVDILAAIVGRVPRVGVHVEENRAPAIVIDATKVILDHLLPPASAGGGGGNDDEAARDGGDSPTPRRCGEDDGIDSFFPVMGWTCGNLSDGKVPLILGFDLLEVTDDNLKAFCAAFGTTGSGKLAGSFLRRRNLTYAAVGANDEVCPTDSPAFSHGERDARSDGGG